MREALTGSGGYLLTGLLFTPDGTPWEGSHRQHYRLRAAHGNEHIRIEDVDGPVVAQLIAELRSPAYVAALIAAAGQSEPSRARSRSQLQRDVVRLNEQISRAMDAAMKLADPAPAYRKIDELERQRKALADEQDRIAEDEAMRRAAQALTPERVAALLADWADRIEQNPADIKTTLRMLVERIVLDPDSLDCRIEFKAGCAQTVHSRESMAFPRGFGGLPVNPGSISLQLIRRRQRRKWAARNRPEA